MYCGVIGCNVRDFKDSRKPVTKGTGLASSGGKKKNQTNQ